MLGADPVWYDDVGVLARRAAEFFPTRDQSAEERTNALVRLLTYATLAVFAVTLDAGHVAFGLAAVCLVTLAHVHAAARAGPEAARAGFGPARGGGVDSSVGGVAGSSRPPTIAGVRPPHAQRAPVACTASTPDNPFGNRLVGDDPARPPACPYEGNEALVRDNFNHGLVRDAFDVYERQNSQRQFYTVPVTAAIPDTLAFARFLRGGAGRRTCKEDTAMCAGLSM